jgi:hypothetical protein
VSVDRQQAHRIAHLARLRFEEEELTRITADLNRILEHVESLEAMDAEGSVDGPRAAASASGKPSESEPGHLSTSGAPTVVDCSSTRGAGAERPTGRP